MICQARTNGMRADEPTPILTREQRASPRQAIICCLLEGPVVNLPWMVCSEAEPGMFGVATHIHAGSWLELALLPPHWACMLFAHSKLISEGLRSALSKQVEA